MGHELHPKEAQEDEEGFETGEEAENTDFEEDNESDESHGEEQEQAFPPSMVW